MTSRNNILSYFLITVALLTGFSSCISVDEFTTSANVSGDIEFVVRPTSYNGQVVHTKATSANDFENRIHNCYLLLFNAEGNRVYISGDLAGLTTYRIAKSEIINKLGANATCTACFIANVPVDIINGLTTLRAVDSTVLDINYSNVDVQDADNGNKHSAFLVPEFDLDGSGSNAPVQCLPMYGQETCNLADGDLFQITLKRLFAKVNVNISVTSTGSKFDIMAAHLYNLPTYVRLNESSAECSWVKDASAFLPNQIEGPIDDDTITGGYVGVGASSYDFYFYVPEYYLSPVAETTANFGNEKYKPQMFETGKRPVFVKLFGTYNDTSNITYDLYLGENAATSFTLKRNVHYINSINIVGITNSKDGSGETLDCRVEITTEKFDEVEMLGQTANCYIIGQTGTYRFPACKGAYKGGVNNIPEYMKCTKGTTLQPLYSDNSNIIINNFYYNKEANEFSFDVVSMDGGTGAVTSNDGNVIIGLVYDEGGENKVEWSWHFWFQSGTSLDVNLGFFDFSASNQTYPSGSVLMDRNLGAKPTSLEYSGIEIGAYYKYGHKEPFLGGSYQGGGESESYDWSGDDKSVTDPCPPGYRVPNSSVWSGTATHEHANLVISDAYRYWNSGTSGTLEISDDIYFPYSMYVEGESLISEQIVKTIEDGVDGFTLPYNVPEVGKSYGTVDYYSMKLWEPREYRNVTYSYVENANHGYLWSQDRMNTFLYKHITNSTSINCEVRVGNIKWTESKRWGIVTSAKCESITWGGWSKMTNIASTVGGYSNIKDAVDKDIDSKGYRSVSTQHDSNHTPPQNYGLQVRCVRE